MKNPWIWISILLMLCASMKGQVYVTNGSASNLGGNCYQLTGDSPGLSGNIFSQNPIDLTQPFTLGATFFFGCKDGNGADGIVFILATTNTIVGTGGGGIGYQGITPSIAVECDDYFNSEFGDPNPDHMAVISMGSVAHNMSTGLVAPVNLPNIENCLDHCFVVNWNPITQTLTSSLDGNTIAYTGDIVNTIFSGTTQVYYGFSAGTGSLSNLHRVCFGPPPLDPMVDVSICEGESINLQADENGVAWTWAPHPTLFPLNVSDPTASPTITTTYTVMIEYPCGYFHQDTVVVEVQPAPAAMASNNSVICEGETLSLMATGGSSYAWSGPMGFTSSFQNPNRPNASVGMAGTYTVTVTDAAGCTAATTTEVIIDNGPDIQFGPVPDPICLNLEPFLLTASPPGGTWSGDITSGGLFNPEAVGEGFHILQYEVANTFGCISTASIQIEVYLIPEILIDPPGILCEESNPIQFTAIPPGGYWEGEITINGLFDPEAAGDGAHLITYTADDANGCTNSADIIVQVVPGLSADINPDGPFCVTDASIQLTADPPGGQWGGGANALGLLIPSNVGPGLHLVTYSLTNQNGCYYGQTDIEILDTPVAVIDSISPLCLTDTIQTLTATPAGGSWSGAANIIGQVDPVLLGTGSHAVIYQFSLTAGCTDADTFNLVVLPTPPQAGNIAHVCDSLNTSYVVLFTLTGGDSSTYIVQGNVNGTIQPGNPYIFTSDPISSGDAYQFIVADTNQCFPDVISGDHTCNCATNSGSMDLNTIVACEGDDISVLLPTGVSLDPDDSLVYILHLGNPDSALFISDTNVFTFLPPLLTGVTYFISSVAGNGMAGTGVDFNDPCLSVSFGTPVRWEAKPSGFISGPSFICEGSTTAIIFTMTGNGPFDISYSDGSGVFNSSGVTSGFTVPVQPGDTTTYSLSSISLSLLSGCTTMTDTSLTIDVIFPVIIRTTSAICAGDSILLGGNFQQTAGVYADSLIAVTGCDSIIETTLQVHQIDTVSLFDTSCDTADTGVFYATVTNQLGCDSTTVTTITYASSDTTTFTSITCDAQLAGTFLDLLTSQNGCDSLVIETITYSPPDTTLASGTTCDAAMAGTFIQTLINSAGCDSLIIEVIEFLPADTTYTTGQTCDPAEAGISVQTLTNSGGCDSLIIEDISLLLSDTVVRYAVTCLAQDTGLFIQTYVNLAGCDSLIWTFTTLAPYDSCYPPMIPKDIFIPNTFSPNGDGINDLFLVFANPSVVPDLSFVRIFDRWGGLVFERTELQPNDATYGWDGTEAGEPLGPGVFVYVVHARFTDGTTETLVGDITLIK